MPSKSPSFENRKTHGLQACTPIRQAIAACWIGWAGLCASAASQSFSQSLPPTDHELHRQEQSLHKLRQHMEGEATMRAYTISTEDSNDRIPVESSCSVIDRVVLTGDGQSLLSRDIIDRAIAGVAADDSPVGRCLGLGGIEVVAQRVTKAVIDAGYVTTQVHVPEQDIESRELRLRITAGLIHVLRMDTGNAKLPWPALAMRAGQVLNLRGIEQSLDNLQRIPGAQADFSVQRDDAGDPNALVLRFDAGTPLRLTLTADDGGQRGTGKVQGQATVHWVNPMGWADMFYASVGRDVAGRDSGPRGSSLKTLHYSLPWGAWQLSLNTSRSAYQQTVYSLFEPFEYSGSSRQHEIQIQRTVHRSQNSKTGATFKLFMRESDSFVADVEISSQYRRSAGWDLGLSHHRKFMKGQLTANVNYRRGTGALDAVPASEFRFIGDAQRTQRVNGTLHLTRPFEFARTDFTWISQLHWQWNQAPLGLPDQLCIGGRHSVRGFDGQTTVCGERGHYWRNELAWSPSGRARFTMYGALDAGSVNQRGRAGLRSDSHLAGVAIGVRGQFGEVAHRAVSYDVFLSAPIAYPSGIKTEKHVAGFNVRLDM